MEIFDLNSSIYILDTFTNNNSEEVLQIELDKTYVDQFFAQPDFYVNILVIIFFGLMLWSILKKDIRTTFKIDKKNITRTITIVVIALITFFMVLEYF